MKENTAQSIRTQQPQRYFLIHGQPLRESLGAGSGPPEAEESEWSLAAVWMYNSCSFLMCGFHPASQLLLILNNKPPPDH